MIPISRWLLFGTAILGLAYWGLIRLQPRGACGNTDEIQLETGLVGKIPSGKGKLKLVVHRRLLAAREPFAYQIYAFAEDQQIGVQKARLRCGESFQHTFEVSQDKLGTFAVATETDPLIPPELERQKPGFRPSEGWLSQTLLELSRPYSWPLGPRPAFRAKSLGAKPEHFDTTHKTAYIAEAQNPSKQAYLVSTSGQRIDLLLVFSQTNERLPQSVYTFTCLLNSRQINVFAGRRSWSGQIREGQGIRLPMQVELPQPGRYRLKCLNLPNLFEGPLDDLPYSIDSVFLERLP